MDKKIIKELLEKRNGPCISIIISSELKSFSDKNKIRLKLRNSIQEVRKRLISKLDEDVLRKLLNKLESLADQVDIGHLRNGIGLFAAHDYGKLIYFPLPVQDRVSIGESFSVAEILSNINGLKPYRVLLLSKNTSRLFLGAGSELTEIEDGKFPHTNEEDFEVQRTDPGSFYNNEESKVDQAHFENYLRQIDELLKGQQKNNPVILLGVQKLLSTFKEVSKNKNLIIGEIHGNYEQANTHELSQKVWPLVEDQKRQEEEIAIAEAFDAILKSRAVFGLPEVQRQAGRGMGRALLLERGSLVDQTEDPSRTSAIEELINTVARDENCRLLMVDNNSLKDYDGVVLTLGQ